MYRIGYISFDNELSEQYQEVFKALQCTVQIIKKEKVNRLLETENNTLQLLDALIIDDTELNNINWVCEFIIKIRTQTTLPLWILVSSESINRTNRIVYLQLGVDGIIDQGHELDESVLMMRNQLKRVKEQEVSLEVSKISEIRKPTEFKLIPQNLSVCVDEGLEVNLTKLEFLAIEYLHKNVRQTMTYEDIYKNVWNDTCRNRKYRVSNLIFHLRQKLEIDIDKPKYIKTIRSKGYMLNI